MASNDRKLSISLFANLLRTTAITWSIFFFLILKECKAIIPSQTHHLDNLRFLIYVLVFKIQTFGLLSKFLICWFMFKDFSHCNSSKLLIWFGSFSAAFYTKPFDCRLSSPIFFIEQSLFFVTWLCDLHSFSIYIPN